MNDYIRGAKGSASCDYEKQGFLWYWVEWIRNNNWVLTKQAEITDAVNSGQLIANEVMKTVRV